jgi:hypothetical protein
MRAYLSSSFSDLGAYRTRASRALRNLQIEVVGMEDYAAADARPLDKCLADVAATDLYVGLFAFRYGYVPEEDNPDGLSITELEYQCAVNLNKPRLVFLVPDKVKWDRDFEDRITGDGDNGHRISTLREQLKKDRMAGWFQTPEQLAEEVSASASAWLVERNQITVLDSSRSAAVARHPRKLQFDLLLLHAEADHEYAEALAEAMKGIWTVKTSSTGLVADSADELKELDRLVAYARSAAILLSPASQTKLDENAELSARVLGIARDRTGVLFGVGLADVPPEYAEKWRLTGVISAAAPPGGHGTGDLASQLHHALNRRISRVRGAEVGLPLVVVAMTAAEATELFLDPPEAVAALLEHAGDAGNPWTGRYGDLRTDWQPFASTSETIAQVLDHAVDGVNDDSRLHGRTIRLQPYPFDVLMHDNIKMWPVYEGIGTSGCLVVIDELSLFHERVRNVFDDSPLPDGAQVALVTLSPLDPSARPPQALLRQNLESYLQKAARRFGDLLDPLCEIGVAERHRLNRWLHGSLPHAVDTLRVARQDNDKIREFAEELGTEPTSAMGLLIAGERGLT